MATGFVCTLTAFALAAYAQTPLGTGFTYQGQLKRLGVPVDGLVDGRFSLWGSPTSTDPSDQVGSTLTIDSFEVVNGLFSVALDFGGSAFNGDARWMEVEIREHGDLKGPYTTLSPREPITPSPYSLQTRGIVVDLFGRVGIGTDAPNSQLEVATTSGDGVMISGGDEPHMSFRDGDGFSSRIGSSDGNIVFRPEGNLIGDPLVTIKAAGNGKVGIGTTTPAARLDVDRDWDFENGALNLIGDRPTMRLTSDSAVSGNQSWIMHLGSNGPGNLEFFRRIGTITWSRVLSLTSQGDVYVDRTLDIGVETVVSGFVTTPAQANCPAGKKVISGGCWCSGNLGASQPNGNAWFCECRSGTTAYAYAICARVR
jgi:hypothetical protein